MKCSHVDSLSFNCHISTVKELNDKIAIYYQLAGVAPRIRLSGTCIDSYGNMIVIHQDDCNISSIDEYRIFVYGKLNTFIVLSEEMIAYFS